MPLAIAFCLDSVEFSAAVIAGDASLGGSESACLGLARALHARGHDVHIFTPKLAQDAPQVDHAGVIWHHSQTLTQWSMLKDWDVCVALRQPMFLQHVTAKFKVLWTQDLMANETMKNYVMSLAWAYDAVAYVSKYHQKQWEDFVPELKGVGFVTKNGHDAALAKAARQAAIKRPNRIIHISRPERGLIPLLTMWPLLKARVPDAELQICRYSSMYDPDGWGEICRQFDREVEAVNREVGGITYLGELGKPALYQAIAEAAVMWYPGVSTFGETSCIAAIESQACGTPFVGSFKGALPETVPRGILIPGVAEEDPAYHEASVAAVVSLLTGCATQSFTYRQTQHAGLAHVQTYSYAAIAEEWERWLLTQFLARYEAQKPLVLRRLMHEDDFVAAKIVAEELLDATALAECDRVLSGADISAVDYAVHALKPEDELARHDTRLINAVAQFEGCTRVVDIACGSGAYAIALATADPARHVTAIDYSQGNIDAGRAAADALGVGDRITWICQAVWTGPNGTASTWFRQFVQEHGGQFDGLWCGEFLEHVVDATGLIDTCEALVTPMGRCAWSFPLGALHALATRHMPSHRTHVHHVRSADIQAIFGAKDGFIARAIPWLLPDARGMAVGNWLVSYRNHGPTGTRPLEHRVLQRPYQRLTVGLITNSTLDLRRCLDAVWQVADEIVIGNTGAPAAELDQIVAEFPRKTRVIDLAPVPEQPDGFSGARNAVLAASTGEWFLWIDSDELLCGIADLGKYLDNRIFRGFVIPQNHLHLDQKMGTDTPTRLFRRGPDIQFYGCVHEQPQMGHCNGDIEPCLQLADVQIAHTGYLHESIRRDKCLNRNLPLLIRDQERFPDRELGKLLVLRDFSNLALWDREQARGALTDTGKEYQRQVVGMFEKFFMDPSHRYHALARPFYENALKHVAGACEVEIGVAGAPAPEGLRGVPSKVERIWIRKPEHLRALVQARLEAMLKPLEVGATPGMDVEPFPVAATALPVEVPA